MSDKPLERLASVDRDLRRMFPVGMTEGTVVQVTIEKLCGFELFNTRPYHNYETWSDGYRVRDATFSIDAEDLDDALRKFEAARAAGVADDCKSTAPHNGHCCDIARRRGGLRP